MSPTGRSVSRYQVPNLERALTVLEVLAERDERGMKLAELTRELGYPKNSVFRVTMTLLDRGYIIRDEQTKAFRLSRKMLSMGHQMLSEIPIVPTAIDLMRRCRDEVKETVLIGTLLETSFTVLEQVLGTHPFKFSVDLGTRLHLHVSAPGKALLAYLPELERDRILNQLDLVRFNERTITTLRGMQAELTAIRECGFAIDREEQLKGIVCVGAPVLDRNGYPIAAIWITGPADRLPQSTYPKMGETMRSYAQAISAKFGHEPSP
jgi:DNA-binding IclR family transcriptional regulator